MNTESGYPVDFDPFAGPSLENAYGSSESQKEIWSSSQISFQASLAYNECLSLRFKGCVDTSVLKRSLQYVVNRHESLRSGFSSDGLNICVFKTQDVAFEEVWSEEYRKTEVETPFDLKNGPLFRARLLHLGDGTDELILAAHHIICDGWSYAVIIKELAHIYSCLVKGKEPALKTPSDYRKYCETQPLPESEEYWLNQFKKVPSLLDLPTDFARKRSRTYTSKRIECEIDPDTLKQIKKAASELGVSLFAFLLSSYQLLLHRVSQQDELVVGIPSAGQLSSGLLDLVGHCVNTLPLKSRIHEKMNFQEFLNESKKGLLDGLDHSLYTYGTLLKKLALPRPTNRLPLIQVLFNLDQSLDTSKMAFGNIGFEVVTHPRSYENFEISVNVLEESGKLKVECQYNSELFSLHTIQSHLDSYQVLLKAASLNSNQWVYSLPIVSAEEAFKMVYEWNNTDVQFSDPLNVVGLIEENAKSFPHSIAVSDGEGSYSYSELVQKANSLSNYIQAKGVKKGQSVAICTDRSKDVVVGLLGILKAGAKYIPLDPAFPKERLRYMIEDSQTCFGVGQKEFWENLALKSPIQSVDYCNVQVSDESSVGISPSDSAYVIYTSGSTGRPKGVEVSHGALANFLLSMKREPGLSKDDVLLSVTTLSFDIAGLEIFLPLISGAKVVLANCHQVVDGELLKEAIEAHQVTVMQATPTTWRMLIAADWQGSSKFKILCGGEAMPLDLAPDLIKRSESAWNMYGPTETTIWSSTSRLVPDSPVTIGRPIANTQVYILDAHLQLLPLGMVGDLYIGGAGLAKGYLGRPDLTAERFIENPFDFNSPSRLYKTGDLARYRDGGNIDCLGRSDYQVKIRGYRIELGEIDAVIAGLGSVQECATVVCEYGPSDLRLVAQIVPVPGQSLQKESVLNHLRAKLPEYMVPSTCLFVDEIPKTLNGKVLRSFTSSPLLKKNEEGGTYFGPMDEIESLVCTKWCVALGVQWLGPDDNFFEKGGHSLLATQVLARLRKDGFSELNLKDIFEAPSVRTLAQVVRGLAMSKVLSGNQEIQSCSQREHVPLSLMQQRVWFLEQLSPNSSAYNLPAAFRFRGKIELELFEAAYNECIKRHEALRTEIELEDGIPLQSVKPFVFSHLEIERISGNTSEEQEANLINRLEVLSKQPFTLVGSSLVQARVLEISSQDCVLFFMPHHLIFDGWSFDIFLRDFISIYEQKAGHCSGHDPLEKLDLHYLDYSQWHHQWIRGEKLERELAYWRVQLGGGIPNLDLPSDRMREAVMKVEGGSQPFEIPKKLSEELRVLSKGESVTLFMTLLAAYKILLARLSGQTDVIVGSPIRGRTQTETENMVGFFVNTLALRTQLDGRITFREFLKRIKRTALEAYSHQDLPLEILIRELKLKRDTSRTPIFQSFFSYQDVTGRISKMGDLQMQQIHIHPSAVVTDLSFWVKETSEKIIGALDFSTALFNQERIQSWRDDLLKILETISLNPEIRLADLGVPSPIEKEKFFENKVVEIRSKVTDDPDLPKTDTEILVANVWASLLQVEKVSLFDNFFDLGGHSLLSLRVISEIERRTSVRLNPRTLLLNTVQQIAKQIEQEKLPNRSLGRKKKLGWLSKIREAFVELE